MDDGSVFKALADPTRRAILDELTERDGQTLFELCARLADHARADLDPPGDLAAPRGPRGGRARAHAGARVATSSTTSTPRPWAGSANGGADPDRQDPTMRITVTSVLVDDQAKALRLLHPTCSAS